MFYKKQRELCGKNCMTGQYLQEFAQYNTASGGVVSAFISCV